MITCPASSCLKHSCPYCVHQTSSSHPGRKRAQVLEKREREKDAASDPDNRCGLNNILGISVTYLLHIGNQPKWYPWSLKQIIISASCSRHPYRQTASPAISPQGWPYGLILWHVQAFYCGTLALSRHHQAACSSAQLYQYTILAHSIVGDQPLPAGLFTDLNHSHQTSRVCSSS